IQNWIHIASKSIKMYSDNRASLRRHTPGEIGRIDIVRVWPNVNEHRSRAECAYRAAGGDKCERRDKDFVAGLNAAGAQREDQRVCSGCDANSVGHAAELRDFL